MVVKPVLRIRLDGSLLLYTPAGDGPSKPQIIPKHYFLLATIALA